MQIEAEITVAAADISRFTERATDFLSEAGVDARATHHVALIFDELLTNLATHGGSAKQTATVRVWIEADQVQGEILDAGAPFDPRSTTDPDVGSALAERPVGGLGLFLVKRFASGLSYTSERGRNRTWFAVSRASGQAKGSE
jgi:serine/threonine-protein kinase RsbW